MFLNSDSEKSLASDHEANVLAHSSHKFLLALGCILGLVVDYKEIAIYIYPWAIFLFRVGAPVSNLGPPPDFEQFIL